MNKRLSKRCSFYIYNCDIVPLNRNSAKSDNDKLKNRNVDFTSPTFYERKSVIMCFKIVDSKIVFYLYLEPGLL